MKKLDFRIDIAAGAAKVWQVLWNDSTYRQWTSVFHEGSHAVSDWKEGSKIQFLSPEGGGMFSLIESCKPYEYMAFKHLGVVKDFEEQPDSEETNAWKGSMETYTLKEENGKTSLQVLLDMGHEHEAFFEKVFPQALALVKNLAEQPINIIVETVVNADIAKVWAFWTTPEHITKWTNASDDWHTPHAENDLRVGGKFLSRMEAKDGSFGFDFSGVYDVVKTNEAIAYTLEDNRKVQIVFAKEGAAIKITETFEAETENSIELQKDGWQAILDNFKKYTEAN